MASDEFGPEPFDPPPPPPSRARLWLRWMAVALALVLAVAAGVSIWAYRQYDGPGPLTQRTRLIIPKGSGLSAIAGQLARKGVIDRPLLFRLWVRLRGHSQDLRAGEYEFSAGASQRRVIDRIVQGDTVIRRLTVPEGLTTEEVLDLVDHAKGLEGVVSFDPKEGTLLPETYYYSWGDTRNQVVRRMQEAMQRTVDELWAKRAPDLPYHTKRKAVILASIIEKETSVDRERRLIAGVFVNRLRKGMRLQSDPTVIYGLTQGEGPLGRKLSRKDLETDDRYNTYVIDGLPPGPIANPGRDSLAAAMNPANTDYLYFVADGSGGHAFAKTAQQHLRNVRKWRHIERERRDGK